MLPDKYCSFLLEQLRWRVGAMVFSEMGQDLSKGRGAVGLWVMRSVESLM